MSTITHHVGRMVVQISGDEISICQRDQGTGLRQPFMTPLTAGDCDDLIQALQGVPEIPKWDRSDFVGTEAGYLVAWLQKLADDVGPEDERAQLVALADAVLDHRHRSQIDGVRDLPYMTGVSRGPVEFDVEMATLAGWSEFEIKRCWQIISAVSSSYARMAAARAGHTRICAQCEQWTFPDRECHLCLADQKASRRCRAWKHPDRPSWDGPPIAWRDPNAVQCSLAASHPGPHQLIVETARPRQIANQPCTRCGGRHQLEEFKVGDRVRVNAVNPDRAVRKARSFNNRTGVVVEWGQQGGPLWVRVEFLRNTAENLASGDHTERDNFMPCELRHYDGPFT